MRNTGNDSKQKQKLILAMTLVLGLTVTGCTKTREAAFGDGEGEDIIQLKVFESAAVTMKASGEAAQMGAAQKLRASTEGEKVRVENVEAPEKLKSMFKDLWITGDEGQAYPVRFSVNSKYVTAYKVAETFAELSAEEKSLAELGSDDRVLVPIFMYPVKAYGDVVRAKNDLKEETSKLRLEQTEWSKAKYVQVSTLSADRLEVAPESQLAAERVFVKGRIDDQLVSKSELRDNLDIRIAGPDDAKYLTQLEGDKLNLLEVLSIDSPNLTEEQREIVRNQPGRKDLGRCDAEQKARVATSISAESCVVVLRYKIPVSHVTAKRKSADYEGTPSPAVEYHKIKPSSSNELVMIDSNPEPTEVVSYDRTSMLNPSRTLIVSKLKGKEFLFRRTMEDSPNSFDYTFAGSAGPLEIVKFVFEKDSVKVVRSQPLLRTDGTSAVDVEPLMIIPASYFREVKVDARGNTLVDTDFTLASHTEKDAIAYVDWSKNRIPNVSSPLDYYSLEQCFNGVSDRIVSDVDQRLEQGMLNFSVSSTYSANSHVDCAGFANAGYFDQVQANFVFKERISFMKYEAKNGETPLLDVPYDAQKRLGFGLFTYTKKTPNKYGNTGLVGTETPLPAIFDVRQGKQVTYVLAGLPEKGAIREKVIQSTREVIADWNEAFRKAFKGTPMERDQDVLALKVEGVDIGPAKLGDLDRNYIYYIQKPTSSGVIGLGGAHANPRSGAVEAASVFMYGGNIFGSVESIKKLNEAKKRHLVAMQGAPGAQPAPAPEASTPSAGSSAAGSSAASLGDIALTKNPLSLNDKGSTLKRSATIGNLASGLDLQQARSAGNALKGRASPSEQNRMDAAEWLAAQSLGAKGSEDSGMALSLYQAFRSSVKTGSLTKAGSIEALVNERILENLGDRMGNEREIGRIRGQVARAKAQARISERMHDAGICLYDASEGLAGAANSFDATDEELFVGVYKPTLAHELGHNLGLRHNFIASFDKANFKFSADEDTKRNYSSVMDYMSNDHETYDGLGPQDVLAIRAAYTGYLELTEEAAAKLTPAGKALVAPGNLVKIDDYRRMLGLSSWMDLSSSSLEALPIKSGEFCSDEDVLSTPICNRFDRGTTPEEIVQGAIDDYRFAYSLVNFPNDKLRFGWWDAGGYIGRLFSRFLPIRMFLEETVYQLATGGGQQQVQTYLPAAIKGMLFFHEVIRTPDMVGGPLGDARFAQLQTENGSQIVVERKWLNNLLLDEKSDRLMVRGIEFDKVIAMLLLTERSFGFRRYERVSLRLAYPDLEKMLIPNTESALQLPTIGLLAQVLTDQVETMANTSEGPVTLPPAFKAEVTSMMRFYAVLGGILNLDVDGLEASDNNSALFRVMSAYDAPKGSQTLMQLGGKEGDDLQYWAANGAQVADLIVGKAALNKAVLDVREELVKDLKEWFLLKVIAMGEEMTKTDDERKAENLANSLKRKVFGELVGKMMETTPLQKAEAKLDAKLAKLPDGVGPRKAEELGKVMIQLAEIAMQLKGNAEAMGEEAVAQAIQNLQNETTQAVLNAPIFSAAFMAIPGEEIGIPEVSILAPQQDIAMGQYALNFRNSQVINQVFFSLHPEYKR